MSQLLSPPILTADDYAMTAGVSRSIEALAEARTISATSVMTNLRHWAADAPRLRELRGHISVGLHLNLTLGQPVGAAPSLAPSGQFQDLPTLLKRALSFQLDAADVRDEIRRQLDLFEQALGFPPDHVDGHQHVQVLPAIRGALLDELVRRYRDRPPLVRDPCEDLASIATKSAARAKALTLRALSAGFSASARRRGLPINGAFAGFSAFDMARPFRDEIIAALDRRQQSAALKIVMCHPGFPDAELATLDPVVARRQHEHDALMALTPPDAVIWHPAETSAQRPVPDWAALTSRG